ncbi:MAG: Rpn family recombination-promoting nuclease/putative transposase [Acidobacteriota bacterium]
MREKSIPGHDRARRLLFAHPQVVEDLLRGFVSEPWVDELDFETLDRVSEISVAESLGERVSDMVWRVRWGERQLYVLVLIEFQSNPDRWMALRLLVYVGQLYQELVRRGRLLPGRRLPPVFPLVLYSGRRRWSAPKGLTDLIAPTPPDLGRYLPKLEYFLVEEQRLATDLGGGRNLMAAIAALEQSETAEDVGAVVSRLVEWLDQPERAPLRRAFAAWLRHVLMPAKFDETSSVPEVDDLLEMRNMLEDTVRGWTRQWLAEGRAEGRSEGRRQGEEDLLVRLLTRRFGELAPRDLDRIRRGSTEQIRRWSERLLTAPNLDGVWADEGRRR